MSNNGDGPTVLSSVCAACGERLTWYQSFPGMWVAVDLDGRPHWATCRRVVVVKRGSRRRRWWQSRHSSSS